MAKHSIVAALAAIALAIAAPSPSAAQCPLDGATPFTAGPVNPNNGFAEFVRDSNDIALELCLDGDGATGFCFFDPVVPGNLFSQQIGFGAEAFWWLSEAQLSATGFSGIIVMAAEAAFATEDPADGDQFPFTRLRLRLDVPAVGTYRVTHPYGVSTFEVAGLVAGDDVNETFDVPFTPGTAGNQGRVGPWLRHVTPAPPEGYIGSGGLGTVTGSPCNTNFFRVERVVNGTPTLVGETNQFVVHGKLYDGRLATPLAADRTTYERDATGAAQADLFATSTSSALVVATGLPAGSVDLESSIATKFFRSVVLGAGEPPPFVAIRATNGSTDATRLLRPLVDVVRITRAEYDTVSRTLFVEATSSDAQVASSALTVLEFGEPVGAPIELGGPPERVPPARVTVESPRGGRDSEPVTVVGGLPANQVPVANPDTATTPEDTPVVVSVLENDDDPDGPSPLRVFTVGNLVNGSSATILADNTVRFTPAANFSGTASFGYTVSDGAASATATVTVTVTAVNDAPVALNDTAPATSGSSVEIAPLANDTDVDGPTPLAIVALTQPANGTGSVQLAGDRVVYTAPAGFSGPAQFTYRAQDGDGAQSGVATVTVTVTAPPAVDLDITRFSASGRVRLARNESVAIGLRVRNGGTVEGFADATVTGRQNGVVVYSQSLPVFDAIGRGDTIHTFPAYTPTTTGAISWTVVLTDANSDVDQAAATTSVQ